LCCRVLSKDKTIEKFCSALYVFLQVFLSQDWLGRNVTAGSS
jgi:hypothetical protein